MIAEVGKHMRKLKGKGRAEYEKSNEKIAGIQQCRAINKQTKIEWKEDGRAKKKTKT